MIKRYNVQYASYLCELDTGEFMEYADHAALIAKIKQAAERAHAEWCAGKGDSPETVRAVRKAFDDLLALCEEAK